MRILIAVFLSLSFGCKQTRTNEWNQQSHSAVFKSLPLPSPTSIRTGSGAPGNLYWQQQVDHTIEVTLDVKTNSISASQVMKYYNNSPDSLNYIWLQLEQNVHRDDSVRSREGRGTGEKAFDGIKISNLNTLQIVIVFLLLIIIFVFIETNGRIRAR